MEISELEFIQAIDKMKDKLSQVRAGRANPNILNDVKVMYYGNLTPLNTVANITVPDFKNIFIKPFDKSTLKEIDKALNEANLGISPNNNGEIIILTFPDLTEERRKEFVKQAKQVGEEGKIALRNVRQDLKDDILKAELSEDEERRMLDELQNIVNKYNKLVDDEIHLKEQELMSI